MTYQFTEINGTNIHYEMRGEGTAVVLIHAGIVNLNMWEPQMVPFAQQHRVLRYDLRGWGETVRPDVDFSHHGDLHDLLQKVGIEKASLVAVSYGGKIALDFALTYPQMVEKLVLVGPALGGYEWTDEETEKKDEAMEAAYDRGNRAASAELETQIWFDGPRRLPTQVNQVARQQIYDMVLHTHLLPEGLGEQIDIDPPAIGRLAEIAAPTLIIIGAEDVSDIHTIAGILQKNIPNLQQETMADTAHFPSIEKPADFNELVLSFLEE